MSTFSLMSRAKSAIVSNFPFTKSTLISASSVEVAAVSAALPSSARYFEISYCNMLPLVSL
jgi:hypothetical protein